MGGFTVNGFGATDRFVPIRNLGTFQCPHCKQERMLQLMEVQRKVSLLYIQTVTINTKYAIACASCQNGYYIEEQQKDDILYGRAIATITEQGAVLLKKEKIIDAPEKQEKPSLPQKVFLPPLETLGTFGISLWRSIKKGLGFIGQSLTSSRRWLTGTAVMRKVDFLFALQDCSYKAVGIVSLVSFMVGLILAFVGAVQLKTFGAQIYVSSLVAIGMTRIMGAIMVGIIMAGRTGASYAAAIGTMQVNEEIDALKTMGIPVADFLVLPRIMTLTLSVPFLVILADFMGIVGGGFVGVLMLDIPYAEYYKYTLDALDMTNFLVGLFHGLVFGVVISLCGCYFGINCGRNADSVGKATTQAVVTAIVWMIVMTGIITFIFEVLGI